VGLTLTTHDTGFDDPDPATIAKVLASLDGGHNVLATLGHSELVYLQASGSVQTGFTLEYQEGSLDQHYRSRLLAMPLEEVTVIFQKYARADPSWRNGITWDRVAFARPRQAWSGTWIGFLLILAFVIVLIWYWRGGG
jgi:hypothetical protein